MQEKLKACRNSNLRDFRRSYLGDYIYVIFILKQQEPLTLHNFMHVKNFIQLRKLSDLQEFHIWQRHLTV